MDPEDGIITRHTGAIAPSLSPVNPVHIPFTYCKFGIHRNIAFLFNLSQWKFRQYQ